MNWPGIILTDSKKLHYSSCKKGICKPASHDNSPQETVELPLPDMRVYEYWGLYTFPHKQTLNDSAKCGRSFIDFAIWYYSWWVSVYYRISSSFQTLQTQCVDIWRGEGRDSDLPLAFDAGCVQCAVMYDLLRDYSDAGNTVLSLVNTPTCRGRWLAGSRAWQWRVHIEIISSFRQP